MRAALRRALACGFLLTVIPVAASAQTHAPAPWFAGGLGGLTFGSETSGAVAGQFGVRIAPNVFVIAEGGRMPNVLPKSVKREFDDMVHALELESGVPISVDFSVPENYVFAGIRWAPEARSVAPFLETGVGAAHGSFNIQKATILGIDVKKELQQELDTAEASGTNLMFVLGGGVTARLSRAVALDAGYRFTHIATDDPSINTSLVYAAVKFMR